MANIFQKIFYKDYQCQIIDMIRDYDVHYRYDEWIKLGAKGDTKCSERAYSIRDKKFFIIVTCRYDETALPKTSYRLYMEDYRPNTLIPAQATQQNTKFAEAIYNKMLDKYAETHNVR